MISGFSNMSNIHTYGHMEFDAAMPMPFKIPIVLKTLLDPSTDLDYTPQQHDLITAIRFSLKAKDQLFKEMAEEENRLLYLMLHDENNATNHKEEYSDLQTHKMEASQVFFDLMNALADLLDPKQYEKLLKLSGIELR